MKKWCVVLGVSILAGSLTGCLSKPDTAETTQQTAARKVIDILKKNYAFSPDTAIGYDKIGKIPMPTQIIAYTIANLMDNGVVKRTDDEKYYFDQKAWDKVVRKVNFAYAGLLGIPVIALLFVLLLQYLLK